MQHACHYPVLSIAERPLLKEKAAKGLSFVTAAPLTTVLSLFDKALSHKGQTPKT